MFGVLVQRNVKYVQLSVEAVIFSCRPFTFLDLLKLPKWDTLDFSMVICVEINNVEIEINKNEK